MKIPNSMNLLIRSAAAVGAAGLLVCGLASPVWSAEKKAEPEKKKAAAETKKKKLTGADLYAIHCNRCHNERYATEFTAAQWKTIMAEMRVRANLPAGQAKAILKYLQEDSGTP
jgi:hypothetical protein